MEEEILNHGEVSLAHHGVLFLDELTEFNASTLELLRTPLEDKVVTISRLNNAITYPCNFMLIASLNPCPCGYYGAKGKTCTCKPQQIKQYLSKISGPLLDRMDIHIEVQSMEYEKMQDNTLIETSEEIRNRVNQARKIQLKRYEECSIFSNSELTPKLIKRFCELDESSQKILAIAFQKLGLSIRGYEKILKLARTIADLDQSDRICRQHITEAIQLRSLDRKYWE